MKKKLSVEDKLSLKKALERRRIVKGADLK